MSPELAADVNRFYVDEYKKSLTPEDVDKLKEQVVAATQKAAAEEAAATQKGKAANSGGAKPSATAPGLK
jgi:hypothetical protein